MIVGLLIQQCYDIFEGPLHYRTLERNKDRNLNMNNDNYDSSCL